MIFNQFLGSSWLRAQCFADSLALLSCNHRVFSVTIKMFVIYIT
jgi:hypothetical protein